MSLWKPKHNAMNRSTDNGQCTFISDFCGLNKAQVNELNCALAGPLGNVVLQSGCSWQSDGQLNFRISKLKVERALLSTLGARLAWQSPHSTSVFGCCCACLVFSVLTCSLTFIFKDPCQFLLFFCFFVRYHTTIPTLNRHQRPSTCSI